LSFDGIDDYVDLGDTFNDLAVPFSISAWINVSSDAVSGSVIFYSDEPSGSNYYGAWFQIVNISGDIIISTLSVE